VSRKAGGRRRERKGAKAAWPVSGDHVACALRARLHRGRLARLANRLLRAEAFVVGRRIFLSSAAATEVARETPRGRQILAHELAHVRQFEELGILRFFRLYAADYLRARLAGASHGQAYASIGFEREARRAEGSVEA
jgi:hypothetical protein